MGEFLDNSEAPGVCLLASRRGTSQTDGGEEPNLNFFLLNTIFSVPAIPSPHFTQHDRSILNDHMKLS